MTENAGKLDFRALILVNKERSTYGIRYSDYQRYRKHCANRVHRLRSSLKMTHGKGREFKKLPQITSEIVTAKHLQLFLFEAERAWAHGQELLTIYTTSKDGSDRRSATGRFRRAQKWTDQLLDLCSDLYSKHRLNNEAYTEVVTYSLLLKGRFMRLRDEFEPALSHLVVARSLLDVLYKNAVSSHNQAVATVYIDESSPEIRHCAHSLGHKKAYEVDQIVKALAPKYAGVLVPSYNTLIKGVEEETKRTGQSGQSTLQDLVWENKPVPVRNPELVDALLKVEVAIKKRAENRQAETSRTDQSRSQIKAFDNILQALNDAEDISKKLSEAQRPSGTGGGVSGQRDIHFLHSYITYQLLAKRTQRDLLLIKALLSADSNQNDGSRDASVDPRTYPAVVKLYDTLLQNLNQIRGLTIVDESSEISCATEARIAFAKAQRCLYMARAYVNLNRYAEALSLTQTAHVRIRESQYQISLLSNPEVTPETDYFPLSTKIDMEPFILELQTAEAKFKKEWFAYNGGMIGGNESEASKRKPLFYDIALNSVNLPMDRLLEKAGRAQPVTTATPLIAQPAKAQVDEPTVKAEPEEPIVAQAPTRSGLSSLLGGWWGRK